VCFVIVTSLRIVTDGNKETTYLLTYLSHLYRKSQHGGVETGSTFSEIGEKSSARF